jgi:hypothetical protein
MTRGIGRMVQVRTTGWDDYANPMQFRLSQIGTYFESWRANLLAVIRVWSLEPQYHDWIDTGRTPRWYQ